MSNELLITSKWLDPFYVKVTSDGNYTLVREAELIDKKTGKKYKQPKVFGYYKDIPELIKKVVKYKLVIKRNRVVLSEYVRQIKEEYADLKKHLSEENIFNEVDEFLDKNKQDE